jgi:hypothetical protein
MILSSNVKFRSVFVRRVSPGFVWPEKIKTRASAEHQTVVPQEVSNMNQPSLKSSFVLASALALFAVAALVGVHSIAVASSKTSGSNAQADETESVEVKIQRALSAAPDDIAKSATVVGTDAQGNEVVLRKGSNGFTCMPGNLKVVGQPPMCEDAASMQWGRDFKAHKPKPTNTVPGITYMLAGATQRSDSDPYDKTSPAITVPAHWMIMWPFDPKATGLPTHHSDTGAYIMWSGSPYAHLHIMGHP